MALIRDVEVVCTTIGCSENGAKKIVSAVYLGNLVYQRLDPVCGFCHQGMQTPATVDDDSR